MRFISSSPNLDFVLFNTDQNTLKVFGNYSSKSSECKVDLFKQYKLLGNIEYSDSLHTIVESPDEKSLILFGKDNIYSYSKETL